MNQDITQVVNGRKFTLRDGTEIFPHVAGMEEEPPYDAHEGFKRLARVLLERFGVDLTLDEARIKHGALQDAAKILDEGESTISNWKNDRGLPKGRIFEMARRLNCDAYFLWGATKHMGVYGIPADDDEQDRITQRFASIERKIGL